MLKKVVLFILFINLSFSFADTLFLSRTGHSTYIQEEEFMVADGENVIGPIFLKPVAVTDSILIEADGIEIEGYFLENVSKDWKKNLKGKFVSVEGEGRVIKGTVIDINDKYIKINTRKGFVITTVPDFPSRIKSPLKWNELFSPQITVKVKSELAQSQIFRVKYPVEGLNWDAEYILVEKNNEKYLTGFINIKNSTPVEFKNLNVILIDGRYRKDMGEIHINSFGEKKLRFFNKKITEKEILDIPDGKVSVFKDGIFKGYRFIKNGTLH